MRVKELIQKLQECDPDATVTIAHFDFGYDEVREIHIFDGITLDAGEADFIMADGQLPRYKTKLVCIGPRDPSAVIQTYDIG